MPCTYCIDNAEKFLFIMTSLYTALYSHNFRISESSFVSLTTNMLYMTYKSVAHKLPSCSRFFDCYIHYTEYTLSILAIKFVSPAGVSLSK